MSHVNKKQITLIISLLVLLTACKITRPPSAYHYAYESKVLKSQDMSQAESDYLDFRLSVHDSVQYSMRLSAGIRKVVHRNTMEILKLGFQNQENKFISSKFCVDREGRVVYSELLPETTAIIPEGRTNDVLRGFAGYRVTPDTLAPLVECGLLTIKIKSINGLHPPQ